ncbi:hypothetical protein Bca52824_011022 [Brassica carinata]|uniref:GTPase Der C-terminal KH-domain-like domain-containing protein n=1 Tax=Brassica carinata TaxID=52824 RepID=A0A8X7WEL4_BRACI|nr:hypothetical protein Bca52824_011022 [Brassica carinata]
MQATKSAKAKLRLLCTFPAGQQGSEKTIRRYSLPSSVSKNSGGKTGKKTEKPLSNGPMVCVPRIPNKIFSQNNVDEVIPRFLSTNYSIELFLGFVGKTAAPEAIRLTTFVFFVNDAKLFSDTYRRYMEKELCIDASFAGTPIRLLWRSRKRSDNSGGGGGTMRMSSRSRE